MKILIFGANGMLGNYLVSWLSKHHTIVPMTRSDLDIYSEFQAKTLTNNLDKLLDREDPDYVINGAGVINKRPDLSVSEMYIVNGYFPCILSKLCHRKEIMLIHPSTGCIYSGYSSMYRSTDAPDCFDDYGASKAIAETIEAMVIRVSIIGEEKNNNRSIVEWVKKNKGKAVNGFTNHFWNGITCLEYAKIIQKIIQQEHYEEGICSYGSLYKGGRYITKHDLVKEISDVYGLNIKLYPYETELQCDRTLIPDILVEKDLVDQIREMKEYIINEI